MDELITLNVDCPVCGKSLMDKEVLVDNCPSIKFGIKIDKNKGAMNLSSVWESHNFLSDIETPEDSIVEIYCPHCSSKISDDSECDICNAPMVPFDLDIGGKLNICSRVGCTNHFVKLVDLTFALKNLFNESDLSGMPYYRKMTISSKDSDESLTQEEEKMEIIKSGTFLNAFCPHCNKSLIEKNMIKLRVVRDKKAGYAMLSPYLNVFTSKSTIYLKEGREVDDLKCFNCNSSLMVKDHTCDECGSRLFRILISARTKLIDFYLCSKKGCRWHGLSRDDLNAIRLEDSLEW